MVQANKVKVAPKLSMNEACELCGAKADDDAATSVKVVSLGALVPFIYPNFFFKSMFYNF